MSVATDERLRILEALREAEVLGALDLFPRNGRVLELGGGDGFQARLLTEAGFEVSSIDLPDRLKRASPRFPVQDYDGHTIPFPDGTFDCVFSSNVLEHIPHLNQVLTESRRVLKSGGLAIHVLPTPSWRFWTTVTHYPWQAQRLVSRMSPAPPPEASAGGQVAPRRQGSAWSTVQRALGLQPHGEYANALAELYYFSRWRWEREFRASGFKLMSHAKTGLFYTGHLLMPSVSVPIRRKLASMLGSSCHVFVATAE